MPSKNVPNIGASWRKPVCKHRVLPRHPVNPESDSLQTSSLHLSPLLFSFYFGEGVERSVALSDRDPSRLERFLQEPGLLMFNSVLVTERSTACYASILEPVMEHMSGLRRADGGGETIGEGGGGRGALLFCPSCKLIETMVSSRLIEQGMRMEYLMLGGRKVCCKLDGNFRLFGLRYVDGEDNFRSSAVYFGSHVKHPIDRNKK